MPVVGDLFTPHLDVPAGGPATTAVLSLLDPDDGTAGVPVTPDTPARTAFTGQQFRLVEPGEWRLFWTITGPGATTCTQVILVDPDPHAVAAGFSYATTGDLARYTGRPIRADARRMLIDASLEIERITKAAVYDTDTGGHATNPAVRAALAAATCELIGWWNETGTATGARALFTNASIAGVSLGFGGQGSTNPQADRIGPRVWSILLGAGLIGAGAVATYG